MTNFTQPRGGIAWIVARMVAAAVAMTAAAFSIVPLNLFAAHFVPRDSPLPLQLTLLVAFGVVISFVYVGLTWVLARFLDDSTLNRCGLVFNRGGLAAFLVVTAAMSLSVTILGLALRATNLAPAAEFSDAPVWATVISGLTWAFLIQGFGEELVWRGYFLRHVPLRVKPAIWLSAAAFGMLHLMSDGDQVGVLDHLLYLVTPFGFAVLAGALVARTGSLWAAVGVHGGSHLGHLILTLLGIGDSSRAWWIGEGALCLIVGLALLRRLPNIPAAALQSNLPAGEIGAATVAAPA